MKATIFAVLVALYLVQFAVFDHSVIILYEVYCLLLIKKF